VSESRSSSNDAPKVGRDSLDAQSSRVGGGAFIDSGLSASQLSGANEGSRSVRRPWLWALGWVGGIVVVIAGLILILR
jgi:hypothetical protein